MWWLMTIIIWLLMWLQGKMLFTLPSSHTTHLLFTPKIKLCIDEIYLTFGFEPISSAICLTCVDGPWRRMAAVGSASRISLFVSLWWVYPDGLSAAVLWRVWLSVLRPQCRTSRVHHSSLAWIWSLWKTDIHLCLDLSQIEKKYHSIIISCIERDLITIRGVWKR